LIVDIAVPRDVDPEVAAIPGVRLIDIDEVGSALDEAANVRRDAIPAVEEIVDEHLRQYAQWYAMRSAEPVISSLAQRAEQIRENELARLFARCPQLGERERMLITGASLTMLSKLLHPAFATMQGAVSREDDAVERYARTLNEIFALSEGSGQLEPDPDYAPDL
jgi:glutamyl-tRNA reductase